MKVISLFYKNNYGYGFSATNSKVRFTQMGLAKSGARCTIHNGIGGIKGINSEQTILIDDIPVTTYTCKGHWLVSWIFNLGKFIKYLKKEYDSDGKNYIIIPGGVGLNGNIIYYIISKCLKYKLVTVSHEWGPTVSSVKTYKKPIVLLHTHLFGYFTDAILPISEYIIEKIKHFKKPYFKLPILADFDNLPAYKEFDTHNFVYCASVYYKRIIMLIIEAYKIYRNNGGRIGLTLILNGPKDRIDEIQNEIDKLSLESSITIKSRLSYEDLYNEYYNAAALIIPLDPNCEQDKARFSQKIAEYLSSKRPIITNNVGEVAHYFTEEEVIKCEYNPTDFANTFSWIEKHPEESNTIGSNGYKKGVEEFSYVTIGRKLLSFLNTL